MKQSEVEDMLRAGVPSIPTNMDSKLAVEYVGLVYSGIDKVEAYKTVFPERYAKIEERAKKANRNVRNTVMYMIQQYEDGKYVKQLYSVGNQNYFTQFVDKRTRMLEELFNIGMNPEQDMKSRLTASKIFLGSIPMPEQKVTHMVEVDVTVDFRNKLAERQKMLYSIANNEEEILDAEAE